MFKVVSFTPVVLKDDNTQSDDTKKCRICGNEVLGSKLYIEIDKIRYHKKCVSDFSAY